MAPAPEPDPRPGKPPESSAETPLPLAQLLPPGPPVTALEVAEGLGLHDIQEPRADVSEGATAAVSPPQRPRVLLNMISTLDGRATLGGRSGAIGGRADHELFHALRSVVDAVMVGAGTARAERYGRLVREEPLRELRRAHGLDPEPLACIVSGRLALNAEIPLLADPAARVAILTASAASLLDCDAHIDYIRAAAEGRLDLPQALAELGGRFGVRSVLCEGGPHLNAQLLSAGLVDELFLSLSPLLAGGDATGEALRILAGIDLDPPVKLELLAVHESESSLFLRYGVCPPR